MRLAGAGRRLLCLAMALALLTGGAAGAGRYPEKEHLPVDYADMLPVTGFDETDLLAALEELEGICGRNRPREDRDRARARVRELYDRILGELDVLATKVTLASVQYDASGGAEEEAALYLELSAQRTRLYDLCYQVFAGLAASPWRDVLEDAAGQDAARGLLGYEGMTEEEAALLEEEDLLTQSYDQIMARGVPAAAGGRVWTQESLESADVDEETRQTAAEALEAERNRAAGEIYRQLLQLRTEVARQAGWDSYADYAYWAVYSRDYELEDAADLREAVKEYILPLQLRLLEEMDQREVRGLDVRSRKSGEEILDAIAPFIRDFDREMGEVFDFMRAHHLYDIEYGQDKLSTGYTMALPAYGSAIIFNQPYGDYWDFSDLVHEFGHFNETFRAAEHDLWADFNIDVGEIDSQALELMFTGYAGEIFGERYGEVYAGLVLYSMLDSVLEGCLYDEFQAEAYANPDMSVQELNRLFKRLCEEYGYYYEPGVEEDPLWVENAHSFQNPMYFISYATSALSALDLWFLYLDDPGRGREVYLDLTALSLSLPYREAVERVGLRDIFDPETVPALAAMLEAHMDGEKVSYGGEKGAGNSAAEIAAGFAAVIAFALLMGRLRTAFGEEQRRRRRHDQADPWSSRGEKPPWEF